MARRCPRPPATEDRELEPLLKRCPECGQTMWADYDNFRTLTTLQAIVRLRLKVRRCHNRHCRRFHQPYRPEEEGRMALPQHGFGLDVIALIGALRYQEHRSLPEAHRELCHRGVQVSQRTVTNLLDRYDELVALSLTRDRHLQEVTGGQGRVILAIDGLQPDMGHEVLWVLRDCLSGRVLLARSLLSATHDDLAKLISTVSHKLKVPVVGVVSDGQHSISMAVEKALPGVPHQLCHFHYLREAAVPVSEADRYAKKELKKFVRGIRPIERQVEGRTDCQADVVRGYCSAVRSALTDDGRPPLSASGLKLHDRLSAISLSLGNVVQKGGYYPDNWSS
jgi:hypothetical protein